VYALAFDMDLASLRQHFSKVFPNNAYTEIRKVLLARGFEWRQGSLYTLQDENMGTLFLAVQDLKALPWFPKSVRDIRAFRVEQWSDLTPIVKAL